MHDRSRQAGRRLALVVRTLAVAAVGWATTALAAGAAASAPAFAAWEPVRLHVIAASDRLADQQAKLRAAEAVLSEVGRLYRGAPPWAGCDADCFLARVMAHRRTLQRAAAGAAGTGPVWLEAGRFFFPLTVDPQGRLYPAGWYPSVRVVIGQGQGRNWWCVVFPSLCPAPRPDEEQSARAAPPAGPPSASRWPQASPAPELRVSPALGPQAAPPQASAPAPAPAPAQRQPWWVRLLPWRWF